MDQLDVFSDVIIHVEVLYYAQSVLYLYRNDVNLNHIKNSFLLNEEDNKYRQVIFFSISM
jgi:hypothetical protein